ncbi:MAG: hypothetical protein WKF77_04830 [Planctomycetaceae bacterium]
MVGRKDRNAGYPTACCVCEMQILQKWRAVGRFMDAPYSSELRSSRLLSSLPRPASDLAGVLLAFAT